MSKIAGSARIHPMSVVDEGAEIGEGVVVGPFCHVGPKVVLGAKRRTGESRCRCRTHDGG